MEKKTPGAHRSSSAWQSLRERKGHRGCLWQETPLSDMRRSIAHSPTAMARVTDWKLQGQLWTSGIRRVRAHQLQHTCCARGGGREGGCNAYVGPEGTREISDRVSLLSLVG